MHEPIKFTVDTQPDSISRLKAFLADHGAPGDLQLLVQSLGQSGVTSNSGIASASLEIARESSEAVGVEIDAVTAFSVGDGVVHIMGWVPVTHDDLRAYEEENQGFLARHGISVSDLEV